MNLDKYKQTNCWNFAGNIDAKSASVYKKYLSFITPLSKASKVLEIGPGNWSFLSFLQTTYHLSDHNISTIDISKSVFDWLNEISLTKKFNNNYWDSIEFLSNHDIKYDLIIMKHVLEHMDKQYISNLIPLLVQSLRTWWQILVEIPNIMNYPFGYYMFFGDFSHYTAFNDKSLEEAFLRHTEENIDVRMNNLFLYDIDYTGILKFLRTGLLKLFYALYIYGWLFFLKLTGLPIKVFTASILCIVTKK